MSGSEPPQNQPLASSAALQGERVAFTGTLASMTHRQAHEQVVEHGGSPMHHVSRQTTMLVVGEEGWPLEQDGQPSQKLEQAQELVGQGTPLRIVRESDWLHLIGLDGQHQRVHQLYTPAMLSQLLELPVGVIRRWERAGLIRPVRRVLRLPYFDFQEVVSVRKLSDLLAAGVDASEIVRSLGRLRELLGDVDRPIAQLQILARDTHVVYRDDAGLIEIATGQRLLEFEPPEAVADRADPATDSSVDENQKTLLPLPQADVRHHWAADDWHREACRLSDAGELDGAIEACRLCLLDQPLQPEIHFQLAELLYRQGKADAAIERYHIAVEIDHDYIEAWTQLGCVLAETGRPDAALDAFAVALDLHPDYPDAHLHRAEILHQLGRTSEATVHWQTYLQYDQRGAWASLARQRLANFTPDAVDETPPE